MFKQKKKKSISCNRVQITMQNKEFCCFAGWKHRRIYILFNAIVAEVMIEKNENEKKNKMILTTDYIHGNNLFVSRLLK